MFCPNCGQQNADNAAFCRNCGAPLAQQQTTYQRAPSNPKNALQAYMKNPLIAIFAALISVVAIFTLISFFESLPDLFKRFKYTKVMGFEGVMYTILLILTNALLTAGNASLAIGSWMTFATGMGNTQFAGKCTSIASKGAVMSAAAYLIILVSNFVFSDLGDLDSSFVVGYVFAMLLFIFTYIFLNGMLKQMGSGKITSGAGAGAAVFSGLLFIFALIGLNDTSLAANTDSFSGMCQLMAYGCVAVWGVVHSMTANKMK